MTNDSISSGQTVFDATRPVAIQLRGPEGLKTIRVRFPSDEEWADRQRRRKVIIKSLGRQRSETTVANGGDVGATLRLQPTRPHLSSNPFRPIRVHPC